MYRVLDLFSGIGGFSLGLERTGGFQTAAFAEIDPYASRVLSVRFPDIPNLGDVQTAEYPDADFICAGFPCQDISFAGAGAGLAGSRSGLWREVVRAIRVVRPRGALLENVAALLGRGLDRVLGDLAEVGHDAEWHCIPAAAVGAPHRRDRIWIATHPRGDKHESNRAPISGSLAAGLSETALANAANDWAGRGEQLSESSEGARHVADAGSAGLQGPGHVEGEAGDAPARQSLLGGPCLARHWFAEPDVGRVAHGVPKRVDRLRCLGNAVVPQIPELIGRAILQAAEA